MHISWLYELWERAKADLWYDFGKKKKSSLFQYLPENEAQGQVN